MTYWICVFFLFTAETLEQGEAISTSFCVLFSFSKTEFFQLGGPKFLTKVAKISHSRGNIIIIKQKADDDLDLCSELNSVKILSWPKVPENTSAEDYHYLRQQDKFWNSLRAFLPKPLKAKCRTCPRLRDNKGIHSHLVRHQETQGCGSYQSCCPSS